MHHVCQLQFQVKKDENETKSLAKNNEMLLILHCLAVTLVFSTNFSEPIIGNYIVEIKHNWFYLGHVREKKQKRIS